MSGTEFKGPICQSCCMPMTQVELFGTNEDGSANAEYCCYCFDKGEFTDPDMTVDDMIALVVDFMVRDHGMAREEALSHAQKFVPTLKRWQK